MNTYKQKEIGSARRESPLNGSLYEDLTIDLWADTLDSATIQAKIDEIPRNLGNHTLTFNLVNQGDVPSAFIISLDDPIVLEGFTGGTIKFQGATTDNTVALNKVVRFTSGASLTAKMLEVKNCQSRVEIKFARFDVQETNGILITDSNNVHLDYISLNDTFNSYNMVRVDGKSKVTISNTYAVNYQYLIDVELSGQAELTNSNSLSGDDDLLVKGIAYYNGDMTTDSITYTLSGRGNICDNNGWIKAVASGLGNTAYTTYTVDSGEPGSAPGDDGDKWYQV